VTPDGYNVTEALSDPQSTSFKYREALDKYREDLADFASKKLEQNEQEQAEKARRQAEQAAVRRKFGEVQVELETKYGFTKGQVKDFFATMQSGDSYSMDNLVKLYLATKSKGGQPEAIRRRDAELDRRRERGELPPPPDGSGFDDGEEVDSGDGFTMDMLRNKGLRK
jgi:hypothetical protein